MMTRFPDLVELEGENRIVQADAYGEDVRGFTEFLGVTIVNETDMVGVQRSKTTISEISSDRDGMGIEVRVGRLSAPVTIPSSVPRSLNAAASHSQSDNHEAQRLVLTVSVSAV